MLCKGLVSQGGRVVWCIDALRLVSCVVIVMYVMSIIRMYELAY